jgi:hypothetical protein
MSALIIKLERKEKHQEKMVSRYFGIQAPKQVF